MKQRRVRLMIEERILHALVHEFNRDCSKIKWFGYDQIFCWLTQCVIDQINTDIPWHTDVCDEVISEIEHILTNEFTGYDADDHDDNVGYIHAIDRTTLVLTSLLKTASYQEYREEIAGCMEDYTFNSLLLTGVDYELGIITMEISH